MNKWDGNVKKVSVPREADDGVLGKRRVCSPRQAPQLLQEVLNHTRACLEVLVQQLPQVLVQGRPHLCVCVCVCV